MKILTVARDLHRRRARERTGLFLVEGVRTVEELLRSPLSIRGVLVAPSLAATPRGVALQEHLIVHGAAGGYPITEVSDTDLASAAGTQSPQGVIAVVEQSEQSFETLTPGARVRILVLDGVQDPGNVGTILRTAEAFGVDATVALPGSVDLWNPKVVRAAMGALFRQRAFQSTAESVVEYCHRNEIVLWATAAAGDAVRRAGAPERLAIVVGNEGGGVSLALREAADRTVAIPIHGMESLNVAVATGILLHAVSS